ncbi:MAG: spore germination protein [Clostridia bacterium]|nr:spore germination protein [Clostridia bacterium]
MPLSSLKQGALTDVFSENAQLIEDAMHIPLCEDSVKRDLTVAGKPARIYFVDGMIDNERIAHYMLMPCMQTPPRDLSPEEFIHTALPVGSVSHTQQLSELLLRVYSGDAALICEGMTGAVICDVKGYVKRSVSKPQTESVVQGPQEGFTETLRDNIVLLRRIMRSPQLISHASSVGSRIPTRVSVLYLKGVAEEENVKEVLRRLEGCNVDYVSSIGMLEQLLEDDPFSLLPQVIATERPDRAASFLLSGQILIALDNAPQMLCMPISAFHLFHAPDDSALRWQYGTFLRFLRLFGLLCALLAPPLFVALTMHHTEGIPLSLFTSVQEAQSRMPIGIFPATLLMLIVFSLINEACIRVPAVMGGSLGVVSALILGQAAVQADLVNPQLIVMVALSGLGSFVLPDYPTTIALRILQLLLVIAGGTAGYFGVTLLLFLMLLHAFSRRSLDTPLFAPVIPQRTHNPDLITRFPVWRQRLRGYLSNPASMLRSRGRMRGWEEK